jgi:pyruvate dehydrogenase E2 component (dihydrolipoamide acetyltransferase)
MGYDMQQGTVVRWLKSEGSPVKRGEAVAEIETDKAVVEFQSYASGVLAKILVPEGTTVPVGRPIAIVAAEGEKVPDTPKAAAPAPAPAKPQALATQPQARPTPSEEAVEAEHIPVSADEVKASPVARKLAEELGVDLSLVKGTGPGGRITKEDVLALRSKETAPAAPAPTPAAATAPARPAAPAQPMPSAAAGKRVPLSKMRQQIARVTVHSKREIPHFYVSTEVDMTQAMRLRAHLNQSDEFKGVHVTVNDLVIKACVGALKKYPRFNASYTDDGIQMHEQINVGIAIAEEQGLIVPAIMDCGGKSLKDIATASRDLAERAKGGTLHAAEYTGGTFSISNLGMFDVVSFTAIILPPQAAVMAVGTVAKRPVVRNDQLVVAETMTASLSADHRVVDGAEGAIFLSEFKRLLEHPFLLMM